MKKYLTKIILFSALVFFIGMINNEIRLEKNYGNAYLSRKIAFLKSGEKTFNTLFVGSSKINNQIDCKSIDEQNSTIHSYNLGANGSFLLSNLETVEYLIQQNDFPVKHIVLELQDKTKLSKLNFTSEQSFSVFDFQNFKFSVLYNASEKNYNQVLYSFGSYILNTLHYNKSIDTEVDSIRLAIIEKHQGFFPLDIDPNKEVYLRHERLIQDTLEIERRKQAFINDHHPYSENKYFTQKLMEIKKMAAAKNIQLILFIVPPAESDAKKLEYLSRNIPIPIINLQNPKLHPEFYELKNRWDYGHLNQRGAEILSHEIAKSWPSNIPE